MKRGLTPLVARVDAISDIKSGSSYKAVFNLRKMHLFESDTQKAIV